MVVVVLGNEVAEIDDGHGLLETRMEGRAGKFGGRHAGDLFHDGMTGGGSPRSKVRENHFAAHTEN
jgi:hypothetical protein